MLDNSHSLFTLPKGDISIITDCKWMVPYLKYTQQYSEYVIPSDIFSYACEIPFDVPGWDEYIEVDLSKKLECICPRHDASSLIDEILFTVEQISVGYYDWLLLNRYPTNALLKQYWMDGRDISGLLIVPGG